ncbi:MAG: phosphatidylserine/phosphatidylglycerophosphate/cardiolipin synthase family protein [Desulfamplus sp.]|nr:phosphatidylserine/phosphatidylglycerophosphate/cardiolipin synthase family protein [Desulfamplus sp.]
MSLIAISEIRRPGDTPYRLIRRLWGLERSERIMSLRIVSAYTDLEWIEKLIEEFGRNRKFQCILDYGASGYNRDQKTTEKLNELANTISTKFDASSGIYLVRVGAFLHSKLLEATTSKKRNLGAVGSLNFTRRGFLGNEEIMYTVNAPKSILAYSEKIWQDAGKIPLNEEFIERNTGTYRDWMLAGCIFFEDKESSPFNFKLGLPEDALSSVSNIHSTLEAKTSDNISILKMLNIKTNTKTPSWKKYCINTCYGYWCPKQLTGDAIKSIEDSVKSKRNRLDPVFSENGKVNLKNDYISLFDEVEKKTRELGYKWDKDKAIKRLDPWLTRVINKLNDESNQRRLLAGVGGPAVVPDLWTGDELALQEFEQSFCSHLVIELSKKKVFNKISRFLWDSDFNEPPFQYEPFSSDDWEDVWYDEDKWLEWLRQQSIDPFEGVAGEA